MRSLGYVYGVGGLHVRCFQPGDLGVLDVVDEGGIRKRCRHLVGRHPEQRCRCRRHPIPPRPEHDLHRWIQERGWFRIFAHGKQGSRDWSPVDPPRGLDRLMVSPGNPPSGPRTRLSQEGRRPGDIQDQLGTCSARHPRHSQRLATNEARIPARVISSHRDAPGSQ